MLLAALSCAVNVTVKCQIPRFWLAGPTTGAQSVFQGGRVAGTFGRAARLAGLEVNSLMPMSEKTTGGKLNRH